MRILLVVPKDYEKYNFIPMGLSYISAILKKNGFKVHLLDMRKKSDIDLEKYDPFFYQEDQNYDDDIKNIIVNKLHEIKPTIIMITVISTFVKNNVFKIAEFVKKNSHSMVVVGGTAVTVEPQKFIENNNIDIVCVGEGEYATLELCQKINGKKDFTKIKNLWVKCNGKIYKNHVRNLIENLDELPFPDRELFYNESSVLDKEIATIIASRGCPYACTYCINSHLVKLYKGNGSFNRYRTVNNVIEEIKQIKEKLKPKLIHFHDETFTLNREWVMEFCKKYKESKIKIPFSFGTNIHNLDESLIKELKSAGLERITIAIESGSERVRKNILKRFYSNMDIIKIISLLKKYGIHVKSNNIIGIPGETRKDALETILLNLKTNPDYHNYVTFVPFPSTELGKIAKMYEIKNIETRTKLFEYTTLSMPNFPKNEIDLIFETANKTRNLLRNRNKLYSMILTNRFKFVRIISLYFLLYLTKLKKLLKLNQNQPQI